MRKIVRQWADELKAGAPLKAGAGGGDAAAAVDGAAAAAKAGAAAAGASGDGGKPAAANGAAAKAAGGAAAATSAAAASKAAAAAAASARTSLRLEETFHCRPADIFECFTAVPRLCAFTQSPATADARPGGAFSWFNGGVTGAFVELEPPRRLVLDWRFSSWPDGCSSRVALELADPEPGTTVVALLQTGIPEEDRFGNPDVKAQVEAGWRDQVFRRVRQVFGFGA